LITSRCSRISIRIGILVCACAAAGLFAPGAFAQSSRIEDRLPPDTFFFVKWNGSNSLKDAKAKNHLLQLLADPEVAPLEIAGAAYLGQSLAKESAKNSGPQLPDWISLLENPVVLGFTMPAKPASAVKGPSEKNPPGMYFVYDGTGKKALLEKLDADSRAKKKDTAKFSKYDFSGVSVEVSESTDEPSYTAYVGSYYVASNRKSLEEDLITRFHGALAPATSITQGVGYRATRKYTGENACIEMFGQMPDIAKLIPDDPKNPTTGKIVAGLHLEKIQALEMSIDLSGEAVRTRGALLGDASPGTFFDLFGASGPTFDTMPAVSGSSSFQISKINLEGLYNYVVASVQGNLPPQQKASLAAAQAMAQSYLGMPLGDALGLISKEFAQAPTYTQEGESESLFVLAVDKPDDILRILRATIGSMILSEDTSGSATFLDITYPYKDPVSGTDRRKFYYVAVTPHMVLAAPRKAMLRDAIARMGSGDSASPGKGVMSTPEYARLRPMLPANLSGLSAGDFRQIPLDKVLARLVEQKIEQQKQSKSTEPAPDMSWAKLIKMDVLTRHLTVSISGWWKDANGVYFDSFWQ
jgi:hypothetical protein